MHVLIACEFSGIVREAFRARGHEAVSVDLLPSEIPGSHYRIDVLDFVRCTPYAFDPLVSWNLMIAFPPCTYLCNSGVRWLYNGGRLSGGRNPARWFRMDVAARFVADLWALKIPRIAIENPRMHSYGQKISGWDQSASDTQVIQPFQFGHGETKATCLRLKGLSPLHHTKIVESREPRVHHAKPGPDRWKTRSRTLQGIADAMAEQWG